MTETVGVGLPPVQIVFRGCRSTAVKVSLGAVVMIWTRNVLAIALGAGVACLLAYLGAVAVLLVTVGIPLGSTGRDPTPPEYGVYLAAAAIASAIGGRTAASIARTSRGVVPAVAAVLAAVMLWGFTGEEVQWPTWWAPTVALAMAGGALTAMFVRR